MIPLKDFKPTIIDRPLVDMPMNPKASFAGKSYEFSDMRGTFMKKNLAISIPDEEIVRKNSSGDEQ